MTNAGPWLIIYKNKIKYNINILRVVSFEIKYFQKQLYVINHNTYTTNIPIGVSRVYLDVYIQFGSIPQPSDWEN